MTQKEVLKIKYFKDKDLDIYFKVIRIFKINNNPYIMLSISRKCNKLCVIRGLNKRCPVVMQCNSANNNSCLPYDKFKDALKKKQITSSSKLKCELKLINPL